LTRIQDYLVRSDSLTKVFAWRQLPQRRNPSVQGQKNKDQFMDEDYLWAWLNG
jgi:hypothetical protein